MYSEWIDAKKRQLSTPSQSSKEVNKVESRWQCPELGVFKVNVDASVFPNAQTFTVGMVMRDHLCTFIAGKTRCFPSVDSVFEAEAVGIREALSWIKEHQLNNVVEDC